MSRTFQPLGNPEIINPSHLHPHPTSTTTVTVCAFMSAYGEIPRPLAAAQTHLPSTLWNASTRTCVSVHHLTLDLARSYPGLLQYLFTLYANELERGMTYPQRGPTSSTAFETYFFAADVFLGLSTPDIFSDDAAEVTSDIWKIKGDRTWEESVAGFYYIKPNYPGRSSHICNGGVVIAPQLRQVGYGLALSKSYMWYAPRLGYRGSVFNLVYANNTASRRIWERLGFTEVGRIPQAGLMRQTDGNSEEYVDALVFYKSFTPRAKL